MVHTATVKIINLPICPDVATNAFHPTLIALLEISLSLRRILFPLLDMYMCVLAICVSLLR